MKIDKEKAIIAIAVFDCGKVKGIVRFQEDLREKNVIIQVQISGLKKNTFHGFHIHEAGDVRHRCESMCAHFNPYGKKHGGPNSLERHVGDLGNLITDETGKANYQFTDNMIKLRGNKANIIGRGLIIHAEPDDLGQGRNASSLLNGNAGKRIGCAIIGYAQENFV
jgi:Cu-Zn family superoxide dismutase